MVQKPASLGKLRCPIASLFLLPLSHSKRRPEGPLSWSEHHDCSCLPENQRSLKTFLLCQIIRDLSFPHPMPHPPDKDTNTEET